MITECDRQEIFECLFYGYLNMFDFETGTETDCGFFFPTRRWVAAMYALLNLSLWELGKKLRENRREQNVEKV